jgi:hypothetical protein
MSTGKTHSADASNIPKDFRNIGEAIRRSDRSAP